MKKSFLIFTSFMFLTGCAQNVALLGPVFSVATTGSVNQAIVGESINHGIKNQTGKNSSDYVKQFFNEDFKNLDCNIANSNTLKEIYIKTVENTNCKKTQ